MKKIIAVILACCLAFSCFAFGASAADSDEAVARLYVCARTSGKPVAHVFIYVENLSSKSIQVGAYTVPKNQGVSVGNWGFRSKNGVGTYYNVEAYLSKVYGHPDVISISKDLTEKQLATVSAKVKGFNFWDPIFFNCVFFAFNVWNSVSSQKFVAFIFPAVARSQISSHGGNRSMKMYQPDRDQVYRQSGSGASAKLSSVSDSMLNSTY